MEDLIAPAVQQLLTTLQRNPAEDPFSQKRLVGKILSTICNFFQRKGAVVALSKFGRKYPAIQEILVPQFSAIIVDATEIPAVRRAALVGVGRMAQANSKLAPNFMSEWIRCCEDSTAKVRAAGT